VPHVGGNMTADIELELCTCPECGAVAEILRRDDLASTSGSVAHVQVRCVRQHWFYMPSAALVIHSACPEPEHNKEELA
jgi:hypothetical protein